ncbi:MAG: chitobiase/beta-hexosaminidase C-terminal domain-containing protein, partial [Eubacteriales bacterium]|nr:chitobiase/beta-hexosaminidase C-terminal domain-containing protein [Eubacteriales bacterium]
MQADKEKEIISSTIDLSRTVNDIDYKKNTQTKIQGENTFEDKNDIDDQVVSSMQKLMEEETSVARAFVNQNEYQQESQGKKAPVAASMKTQVIPDISKELEKEKIDEIQKTDDKDKKKLSRNQKIKIAVVAGIAALLIIIAIVTVLLVSNNNRKKSYDFNYKKGMELYDSRDYSLAVPYMEKAAKSKEGSQNTDLLFDLYICYRNTNQKDKALETLQSILNADKYNKKAIQAMAEFYAQEEDSDSLNSLIKNYRGTEAEQYLADYIVKNPAPSKEAGTYNENVKLQFVMDSGCKVYYTLDGSAPTQKSNLYSDIIEIKSGITTIKAVAINSSGIYSDVVELRYEIDYKKPTAPSINPASGSYESGQMISVDYIPDGSRVYYTTDGSVPTKNSKLYTEGFPMPDGNTIVSAIIVDQNGQISDVTRRNYVVSKAKQLTYDEAEKILKTQLQNKGLLK